jgi:hypothetical protein
MVRVIPPDEIRGRNQTLESGKRQGSLPPDWLIGELSLERFERHAKRREREFERARKLESLWRAIRVMIDISAVALFVGLLLTFYVAALTD